MTDIVRFLRGCDDPMMQVAADEIEALRLSLLLLRGERDRITDEKNAILISRTLGQPC